MTERIATAKILLLQFGPTMTLEQFGKQFAPEITLRVLLSRSRKGTIPPLHFGLLDSQEVGDWWDSFIQKPDEPIPAIPRSSDGVIDREFVHQMAQRTFHRKRKYQMPGT